MLDMIEYVFGHGAAEVTLEQMLEARDRRTFRQREITKRLDLPLISFTMNIAGPVKVSDSIIRAFEEGCALIELALERNGIAIAHSEKSIEKTGCVAFFCIDADVYKLKRICVDIEDTGAIGRLFDIDVLDANAVHISRQEIGETERGCIVCNAEGKGCASRRLHSVVELREKTSAILYRHFLERDAAEIMQICAQSLRLEVWTTPKPGLVDLNNNGSHDDMDLFTMMNSITAIAPYFKEFFISGVRTAGNTPEQAFTELRKVGIRAEKAMFGATGGVNTHKGAVFLLGVLCGACGRLWTPSGLERKPEKILDASSELSKRILKGELDKLCRENACSFGEKLYTEHGITGARGQAMEGFPAVRYLALPRLYKLLSMGRSIKTAGAEVLLYLISEVQDTNIIRRSSVETQKKLSGKMTQFLKWNPNPDPDAISKIDEEFIKRRLSPGGCADLLSVTYFLYILENGGTCG